MYVRSRGRPRNLRGVGRLVDDERRRADLDRQVVARRRRLACAMARRSRASTSAGPAVSSRTSSSAPLGREASEAALGEDGQQGSADPGRAQHPAQGAGTAPAPVAHRRSTTSQSGESTRAVASAGRTRTVWLSSPRAGSTSALGASALVSSSRRAISCRIGETGHRANQTASTMRRSEMAPSAPEPRTASPAVPAPPQPRTPPLQPRLPRPSRCATGPRPGPRRVPTARRGRAPRVGEVVDAAVAAHPELARVARGGELPARRARRGTRGAGARRRHGRGAAALRRRVMHNGPRA